MGSTEVTHVAVVPEITCVAQPGTLEYPLPVEYSKFTVPVAPAVVVEVIVTDVLYVVGVAGIAATEIVLALIIVAPADAVAVVPSLAVDRLNPEAG